MDVMNAGSKPYKKRCLCSTKLIKRHRWRLKLVEECRNKGRMCTCIFSKTLAGNPRILCLPVSSSAILYLHEVPSFERSKSFSIL